MPILAAAASLDVAANRADIYLGESVLLTVKVSNGKTHDTPDLSALQDCDVEALGSRGESRSSLSFVNGQWKRTTFSGRIYTYRLTPRKPGVFRAGPITVSADGGALRDPGPRIRVAGIEQQDRVRVRLDASRDTVLVDEPFEIVLSVAIRNMPPPHDAADPLNPEDPPLLSADYLDAAAIEGLETPDVRAILQERLVSDRRTAGFALNNYTVRPDPFDMRSMFDFDALMQPRAARFRFDRRSDEIDGNPCYVYTLRLAYVPKEEGSYTFGPALFKGPVLTGIEAGQPDLRRIFAVGPACTVRVVPPPEAGRPASYIGAIGTALDVAASLDAQTCSVGDPLTLTLSLGGDISLDNIEPPALTAQTNLVTNFRIYDDSVRPEREPGQRRYRYTVRPTRAGTLEFPPVEIA
ncbi:MAG: BatD family protein, partial [Lentisphaerae bacterium]|nr:BatD family protein [Lentisphaerota bacterium]